MAQFEIGFNGVREAGAQLERIMLELEGHADSLRALSADRWGGLEYGAVIFAKWSGIAQERAEDACQAEFSLSAAALNYYDTERLAYELLTDADVGADTGEGAGVGVGSGVGEGAGEGAGEGDGDGAGAGAGEGDGAGAGAGDGAGAGAGEGDGAGTGEITGAYPGLDMDDGGSGVDDMGFSDQLDWRFLWMALAAMAGDGGQIDAETWGFVKAFMDAKFGAGWPAAGESKDENSDEGSLGKGEYGDEGKGDYIDEDNEFIDEYGDEEGLGGQPEEAADEIDTLIDEAIDDESIDDEAIADEVIADQTIADEANAYETQISARGVPSGGGSGGGGAYMGAGGAPNLDSVFEEELSEGQDWMADAGSSDGYEDLRKANPTQYERPIGPTAPTSPTAPIDPDDIDVSKNTGGIDGAAPQDSAEGARKSGFAASAIGAATTASVTASGLGLSNKLMGGMRGESGKDKESKDKAVVAAKASGGVFSGNLKGEYVVLGTSLTMLFSGISVAAAVKGDKGAAIVDDRFRIGYGVYAIQE